jgi:hypothetical protein
MHSEEKRWNSILRLASARATFTMSIPHPIEHSLRMTGNLSTFAEVFP